MARDFKSRPKDRKGAGFGSSVSFVTGLLVGLTVAAVVYFTGLGHRPPASVAPAAVPSAANEPEAVVQEDHSALAPLAGDAEAPPEPEFDFYTILPNTEVKVPEAELAEPVEPAAPVQDARTGAPVVTPPAPAPAQATAPTTAPVPPETPETPPVAAPPPPPAVTYIVQVGAYQRVQEADQTKALLALQGISSAIQRITKEGQGVWFRVVVGPYATAQEAQSARVRVGDAGFKGLVLKSVQGPG
jgi:cell division protein FtsN